MYETELMEEEREAVQDLLNYLDSGRYSIKVLLIKIRPHLLLDYVTIVQEFYWFRSLLGRRDFN